MTGRYYTDDAPGIGRYGASYGEYGARQAAQVRRHASGALPYDDPPYDREGDRDQAYTRRLSRYEYERSRSPSYRDHSPGADDPIRRAHSLIKGTFSNTPLGLGIGVLGAVVGGVVAHEAGSAVVHHDHRRRSYHEQESARLAITVLGAVVGALGANAIENRFERSNEKAARKEEVWEKKWHKDSRGRDTDDYPDYDRGRRNSQRDPRDWYYG